MSAITGILAASDNNSPNVGIAYTTIIKTGGEANDYQLDIYHLNERSRGNRPVIVAIHGGGYCVGDKSLSGFIKYKADFFVRTNKCVLVSINYRLSPVINIGISTSNWDPNRVKFPNHYEDQATAIKWIYDNISSYGGNPDQLILMGHSAGAQCATILGTSPEFINVVGVPPTSIKGIISVDTEGYNVLTQVLNAVPDDSLASNSTIQRKIYENAFGVYPGIHTGTAYQYGDFPLSTYGSSANSIAAANVQYNRASPDQHLNKLNTPKVMIIGRGSQERVNIQNSFYSSLTNVGISCTYISYPESTTYTHEEISQCIGSPIDPPEGRTLPPGISNVSTEITKFISSLDLSKKSYPVMGTLYVPNTNKVSNSLDLVVLLHGTLPADGTGTIEDASKSVLNDIKFSVNVKDKILFSIAYPQDQLPPIRQYNLSDAGTSNPNFLIGDGIPYIQASLRWAKKSLNQYLVSQGISKQINRVYLFGHSQGGYSGLILNTMEKTDGVILNSPGPLKLDYVCTVQQQNQPPGGVGTCDKIYDIYGNAVSNSAAYFSRSGSFYTDGHIAPMLFLQAQDDDTGQTPSDPNPVQYGWLVDVVNVLKTKPNPGITTSFVASGGHTAYKTSTTLQAAIRSFVNSNPTVSNTITAEDIVQITITPSDNITESI